MATTPTDWQAILSRDLSAFVRHGMLFRLVSDNDDDCRRDTVEQYVAGKWVNVVIASLDWETELDGVDSAGKLAA